MEMCTRALPLSDGFRLKAPGLGHDLKDELQEINLGCRIRESCGHFLAMSRHRALKG